jgi:hypothetical protein
MTAVNKENALFSQLERLAVEHYLGTTAICNFLDHYSETMLGLTATEVQILRTHTEQPNAPATKPHLRLVPGARAAQPPNSSLAP